MSHEKIKIVWLDINSSYSHSSMALPAIEAQRQLYDSPDMAWTKVSGTINSTIGSVVEQLVEQKPQIIAYTAWLFNHDFMLQVLSRYKVLCPSVIVVGGGPEYLGCNREFLSHNKFIDIVFSGEGEKVFHEWLKVYDNRDRWHSVKGASFFNQNGEYIDNGIAKVIDFSALNTPESSDFFDWNKPFIQIESTRGCFNSCAFCVSGADKPVRSLDISILRERLQNAVNKGINDIRLLDRTFNGGVKRAVELLDLFCEFEGRLKFHLEVHPALFQDDLKQRIAQMPHDLLHIEAGVQSLNDTVLRASKRFGETEKTVEGLKFLCSMGIFEVHSDLIAGLPHYTLNQIYGDVARLSEINCDEIQLELLKLLPGTVMRAQADDLGIKYSSKPPYEVMESDAMTYSELQESARLSRVIDMYYNCKVWQSVFRELIAGDKLFLKNYTKELTDRELISQPMSMERRGILLYDYCLAHYPESLLTMTICWISGGLSLKKSAGEGAVAFNEMLPSDVEYVLGAYDEKSRIYMKRVGDSTIYFGYNRSISNAVPQFVCIKN